MLNTYFMPSYLPAKPTVILLMLMGGLLACSTPRMSNNELSEERVPQGLADTLSVTVPEGAYLPSLNDSIDYALGMNVGRSFGNQGIVVSNVDKLLDGLRAVLSEPDSIPPVLTDADQEQLLGILQQRVMERQQEERIRLQTENLAIADSFLTRNGQSTDVVTTESGLQYKVIRPGTGKTPGPGSSVRVHYSGRFLDGSEFDSSYRRGEPARFGINGVIRGWTEALQLMQEGAVYELYIPPHLGYGENGNQRIPPNSLLIFQVELIEAE